MKRYNPAEIEPKWQQHWAEDQRYRADDASSKPKYYVTGMFPYPSGAGMHAGHFMEHSIVDAVARFRRSLGHEVLYPMGWDSFGLPAENYAIKTGKTPQETTATAALARVSIGAARSTRATQSIIAGRSGSLHSSLSGVWHTKRTHSSGGARKTRPCWQMSR